MPKKDRSISTVKYGKISKNTNSSKRGVSIKPRLNLQEKSQLNFKKRTLHQYYDDNKDEPVKKKSNTAEDREERRAKVQNDWGDALEDLGDKSSESENESENESDHKQKNRLGLDFSLDDDFDFDKILGSIDKEVEDSYKEREREINSQGTSEKIDKRFHSPIESDIEISLPSIPSDDDDDIDFEKLIKNGRSDLTNKYQGMDLKALSDNDIMDDIPRKSILEKEKDELLELGKKENYPTTFNEEKFKQLMFISIPIIEKILKGNNNIKLKFQSKAEEIMKSSKSLRFSNLESFKHNLKVFDVGYYGLKGQVLITNEILKIYRNDIKKNSKKNLNLKKLINFFSLETYTQYVLAPEVALRMIMNERNLSESEAYKVQLKSSQYGRVIVDSST